jgi:acyl carrier protein
MSAKLFILQTVFREVFDDPALVLTPQTIRTEIDGWDSVAQVRLILAVEEQFGFNFTEAEVPALANVADFLAAIARHDGEAG